MEKPLRKCRECGLKAYTESDLELFVKTKNRPYGRGTSCKKCEAKRGREYNKDHPLRRRYLSMIGRCHNPNFPNYPIYGGRGIYVVEEWRNNRQAFIDWGKANGFKPELSIDRIDNDGPYAPCNCRWATDQEQQRNTRRNSTNFEKGTRICSVCKVEKPLTEFHKSRHDTLGHVYRCKTCINESLREHRKKHGK